MQDNTGTLTLQASLTRIGKRRLSEGRFKITKYAFSDDGINYKLYNNNIIDPTLIIKRTPLFSVWKDSPSVLKNKITSENLRGSSSWDYELSYIPIGETHKVKPASLNEEINFPRIISNSKTQRLDYFLVDSTIALLKKDVRIEFSFDSLPVRKNNKYISVILHDNTFFDIALVPENVQLYSNNTQDDAPVYSAGSQTPRSTVGGGAGTGGYAEILLPTQRAVNFQNSVNSQVNHQGLTIENFYKKNWEESIELEFQEKNSFPKTINVLTSNQEGTMGFILRYRGNYNYKNPDVNEYQTFISVISEDTGQYQLIRLLLKPTTQG